MNTRAWIAASVVATAAAIAVGCTSESSSHTRASDEATGTIAAALSSVGPDGATYLLNNVEMGIVPTGDAGVSGGILFFGSGNQTNSMAVGSYAGTLQGGPTDGAVGWTITRQASSGPTSVSAVLLDPQPYLFTISPGMTTNLTLHFEVASVGAITFAAGSLSTDLSVEAGTLPPGHAAVVATASFPQTVVTSGNTALDSLLTIPAAGTGDIPFSLSITFTSPFVLGVDNACANATASVNATALPDAGTEDVYAAFFQEVDGASGQCCVNDATSQFGSNISFVLNRIGPPATAAFQSALGLTANTQFQISMAQSTVPPYLNNGVLSLDTLSSPVTLPVSFLAITAEAPGVFAQLRTSGQSSTLQVSP
jgi:hypothetical protein